MLALFFFVGIPGLCLTTHQVKPVFFCRRCAACPKAQENQDIISPLFLN